MTGGVCSDLVEELAYIEKSGCLRYIKIDYTLITNICSRIQMDRGDIDRELGVLVSGLRDARNVCGKMQETPENMREELYGIIYSSVKRSMERLGEIYEELRRTYRLYIASLAGLAIAVALLSISIIITSTNNIYILMIAMIAGLLSLTSIAMANSSLRLSITISIASSTMLLLCGIQLGDVVKTIASIITLAASIATSHRFLTK